MSITHEKVVKLFSEGVTNKKGCNVFSERHGLYSYGKHFALVLSMPPENNLMDSGEWYLCNADKYSVSTSTHQGITFQYFKKWPRVAFSALEAAEINLGLYGIARDELKLVDFWADEHERFYPEQYYADFPDPEREKMEVKYAHGFNNFESIAPFGATKGIERADDGSITCKWYHRVGSVVLRFKDHDYLCSMDEGSYFVSRLPKKVSSVKEAFDSLKPDAVKEAEQKGLEVKRQGEWFFIPEAEKPCPYNRFEKSYVLPSEDSRSNRHVCTRGIKLEDTFYVYGNVWHKEPDSNESSGEHRRVSLGKVMHTAVCNLSLANWSASGNVD